MRRSKPVPGAIAEPLMVSRKEAGVALGISMRMVDRLIIQQRLRSCQIGRRVLIPVAELKAFTERQSK